MSTFAEQTIELISDMVLSRYMIGAGLSVLAYDWILTLPDEMRYIWRARWSKVKAIFLINRYLVPCVLAFAAYGWSGYATFLTPFSCKTWITVDSAIQLAFFATLHWVVAMRAWTLYGRTLLTACIIWGGFVIYLAAAAYLLARAMIDLQAGPVPFVNVCFGDIPQFLWSIWLPSMAFETLVFALTAVKAVHHNRHQVETPILTILYRDGFLYFIFICMNSFANLLVWAIAPPGMVLLARYFTMALCEVAGSHLILDLIEIGHLTGASNRSASTHISPHPNPRSHHPQTKAKRTTKKSIRAHGGDDAYEMMPSPCTPNGKGMTESFNSWTAPGEWDYEGDTERSKGIRTLLREADQEIAEPTKTVQWKDRRCYISPGQAM